MPGRGGTRPARHRRGGGGTSPFIGSVLSSRSSPWRHGLTVRGDSRGPAASATDRSCSGATTMLDKRPGIAAFEFEEGRERSVASQREVGIKTIR